MSETQKDKTIDTMKNVLQALCLILIGWMYNAHDKLEDRVYSMQASAMTTAAAQQMEDRINRTLEVRISDLVSRLDVLLKLVQTQNKK